MHMHVKGMQSLLLFSACSKCDKGENHSSMSLMQNDGSAPYRTCGSVWLSGNFA